MTFRSKTAIGLGVALALLFAVGLLSYMSVVHSRQERSWVLHTHEVVESLDEALFNISTAETKSAEYLLSGHAASYLSEYQAALAQAQQDVVELRKQTLDNPARQRELAELERLLLAQQNAGPTEMGSASQPPGAGNNTEPKLSVQAKLLLVEMKTNELDLLSNRITAADTSFQFTRVSVVLANVLAICFLVGAGTVIRREMAERKRKEESVVRLNGELEGKSAELVEANKELQTFTYSVAHDLRAPLRQISGFSRILSEEHGAELSAEAGRYLSKVQDGTQQMGRLVDDLLNLSRVGQQALSVEPVPLRRLVDHAIEQLEPELSGRNIRWQIEPALPTIECDPALMKQVFVNLISNAIKYTRRREQPNIQVGVTTNGPTEVVFVRDNGVGFDMRYADKLFGVFQRLHKAQDFEGTGVGLAIVERIIRKHGGKIWTEAKPDKGAVFFFTIGTNPATEMNSRASVAAGSR
jgi:signal transduction histidine kinase